MDILLKILSSITLPQITWATIFAALGYLLKTLIEYYIQRKQKTNDLSSEAKFEQKKEQETVRVAVLGQVLQAQHDIHWIFHQFLGHAKNSAESQIREDRLPKERKNADSKAHIYTTTAVALGLGRLFAQMKNFHTYQYIQTQKRLSGVDLLKKIDNLEDTLSKQGIYRNYQEDLSLYALKATHSDLEKIVASPKSRSKEPVYLSETVLWADRLMEDFVRAWMDFGRNSPRDDDCLTLEERSIDLSQLTSIEFTKPYNPEYGEIKPDVPQLRITDSTAVFVKTLNELYVELQAVFLKLDESS